MKIDEEDLHIIIHSIDEGLPDTRRFSFEITHLPTGLTERKILIGYPLLADYNELRGRLEKRIAKEVEP